MPSLLFFNGLASEKLSCYFYVFFCNTELFIPCIHNLHFQSLCIAKCYSLCLDFPMPANSSIQAGLDSTHSSRDQLTFHLYCEIFLSLPDGSNLSFMKSQIIFIFISSMALVPFGFVLCNDFNAILINIYETLACTRHIGRYYECKIVLNKVQILKLPLFYVYEHLSSLPNEYRVFEEDSFQKMLKRQIHLWKK